MITWKEKFDDAEVERCVTKSSVAQLKKVKHPDETNCFVHLIDGTVICVTEQVYNKIKKQLQGNDK